MRGDNVLPTWKESIRKQREALYELLAEPLQRLAAQAEAAWPDRESLSQVLLRGFASISYCTYLYVVDTRFIQVSDNVGSGGRMPEHFGRDRSARPYMKEVSPDQDCVLSGAYISLSAHRPSITAVRALYRDGERVGYLGADFDLRNLPMTGDLYREPSQWQQIKGDPAIRGTVFQQTRAESELDHNIDQAISILEELLVERGVFQMVMHFSSSRATIWLVDDPFRYRILQSDALSDPDICLAYPKRPYPEDAEIPAAHIGSILRGLKSLRFADKIIYLRSASLNLFNGMVSLTFSCDGSHYMPYAEFLEKDASFWF